MKKIKLNNPSFEVKINGKWLPVISFNYHFPDSPSLGYSHKNSGTCRWLQLDGTYKTSKTDTEIWGWPLKDVELRMSYDT